MECVGACDPVEGLAEGVLQLGDGAEFASSEFVLDLREDLFDGVEVGAVGRQVQHSGSDGVYRFDGGFDLVGLQVVQDEDVAGSQVRGEFLSDIGGEELAVEGAVEPPRGEESVESKGGQEGGGFPVSEGRMVMDASVGRAPSVEAGHGRGGEGFVEEDEAARVDAGGEDVPDRAVGDDIGAGLFGGVDRFF